MTLRQKVLRLLRLNDAHLAELTADHAETTADLQQTTADLAQTQAALEQAHADLAAWVQSHETMSADLGDTLIELSTLRADLAACRASLVRTRFGACPAVGASPSSVVAKYGQGAAVRLFYSGGFKRAQRPAGVSLAHVSWKPALVGVITEAELIDAFASLQDGDLVEVWHEADVKHRKGMNLTVMLAMKDQFHAKVVALRDAGRIPDVLTVNTWAGWSVDSTSPIDPSNLHCRADLLGLDMDGLPAKPDFYPFAARQMGAKFAETYKQGGYKGWTVPEFTMPAVDSDPDRTKRIAWFTSEAAKIARGLPDAGIPSPRMVAWFDTDWATHPEDESLTKPNEVAAWAGLVAANAP